MKRFLSLMLTATLLFSLTACKSGSDEQPSTSGTSNNSQPSSSTETIEFWSVFTGADGANMQAIIDSYNKTNPPAKVIQRAIEQNELYQKLPLVIQSGKDVPDLAINHVDRLALNQENGMYLALDDFIAKNGKIKEENYIPAAWEPGEIDGKRYSIPLDVHSYATYYNKELVQKYAPNVLDDGVITFDEIATVAPAATKDGIYTYAVTWARPQFLGWYAQLGGKLSENGVDPSFNNDKALKVLNDFKAAVDNKWATQDGDDPIALFGQGKLIFLPEGTWMMNTINELSLEYGETYAIAYDASKPLTWSSSHQFVLPKKDLSAEKAAAIMDFINYVGEHSISWAQAGQVPASVAISKDEAFKKLPHSFLMDKPEFLDIPDYQYYGYAVTAIDEFAWDVPFSRKDAKTALEDAVQKVSDAIKNQ